MSFDPCQGICHGAGRAALAGSCARLCRAATGSSLLRPVPKAPVGGRSAVIPDVRYAWRTSLAIIMPTSTAEHSRGQSGGGGRVGLCASARAGLAAMANRSERPVHSAEQPADPERYYRHRIGPGFDSPAKPLVKWRRCRARRQPSGRRGPGLLPPPGRAFPVSSLWRRLPGDPRPLRSSADVSSCAGYSVFIHGIDPSRYGRRGRSAPLFVSHPT